MLPSLRPKQSVTKSSAGGSSSGGGCNSAFVLPAWVAEPWPSNQPTLPPIILLVYIPREGSGVLLGEPLVQYRFLVYLPTYFWEVDFPRGSLAHPHPLIPGLRPIWALRR